MNNKKNILFCASEALPYIKTGGLADVAGSLPQALAKLGHDVILVIPAYQSIYQKVSECAWLGECTLHGFGKTYTAKLVQPVDIDSLVQVIFVEIPELFSRDGGPYLASDGYDWWDNGERFSIFSKAIVEMAMDRCGLGWRADVVHSNDWQTGLVSGLLTLERDRPKTIFTIHNMAYQGNFPYDVFKWLGLPHHWWHENGVEFHGGISMLKAGIMMSDRVTTVSPTYANEICLPQFAYGLDGAMNKCRHEGRLSGILNGVDHDVWHPLTDQYIEENYSATKKPVSAKAASKAALYKELGAQGEMDLKKPLIGFVGRLVSQKGIDLVLEVLPDLIAHSDANFVFVGSGDHYLEGAIQYCVHQYPERVFSYIGYSERLAHLVEAGSDLFVMPSRFEPCGLNQIYSLLYGTPPIVHHTGGLADTVINATTENIEEDRATGFVFYEPTAYAVKETIYYALAIFNDKKQWNKIRTRAMKQDFTWQKSAEAYSDIYA